MLTIIALVVLAALALLLFLAARRPDTFRVQRSAVIKAPAATLFGLLNDLRLFNTWNPWQKKDPGSVGQHSGPAAGVGAAYAWDSRKLGAGRMEITASQAPNKLVMQLDFRKPFQARNIAEFTLQEQGERLTVVTWAMHGPAPFMTKLMDLVVGMDRMVGRDFEAGLRDLKALTERR